ncbi:hypothetical protein HXA34_20460 [Salipaludibacillus agaradhaerens]|jgi:hypothetical protein|uniref:hypothetical protein n=1 Tax=Salipaludibacillus agaradhaerens TaxID=76935 RepID=UPI0021512C7E|nr:hypothetical protein [Salipaludibacillus agaradhaerens]MCR6108671.1 hypothetical protein [Salipaludibacillus agaradhaerens]MCR6120695.1 hypothetical protein [Salipaludibacillus agaradhaerens]
MLNSKHIEEMRGIEEGATIWGYVNAKLLREVQRFDHELITVVSVKELEVIENTTYDGSGKLPYFGAILTKKGKEFLESWADKTLKQT